MVQRNGSQGPDFLAGNKGEVPGGPDGGAVTHGVNHLVGQHAALGNARGAAGVLQADGVVHGDFNVGLGVRMCADEGVEVIQAVYLRQFHSPGGKLEGDDALHRALGVLQHGDRLGGEGSHDHNGFGAAVIELPGQLGYGVERVGRNFDGADLPHGVHRQQVLRHVGCHDRYAVALFDAQVDERVRQPARHIVAVGVGEYEIAQNGVRLLRVGLRPVVEPPFAGLVLILDLFPNLRIVLFARLKINSLTYLYTAIVPQFCISKKPFIHLKGLFEPAHILLSYLHL